MSGAWTSRSLPSTFPSRRKAFLAATLFVALATAGELFASPPPVYATRGGPGTGSHIARSSSSSGRSFGYAGTDYARRTEYNRHRGFPAYTQTFRRSMR